MTKRTWTWASKISARLLVTLGEINSAEGERPQGGRVRDGILMTAIRPILGLVAALALGLGMGALAHAQTFCAGYPCYHIFVDTTDGGGLVSQFSDSPPFSLSQQGSFNGNQESAFGIAQFGSIGSATSVDLVTCPIPCTVLVQANAGGQYFDVFDLRGQGLIAGYPLQFTMALSGPFGSGPPLAQVSQYRAG